MYLSGSVQLFSDFDDFGYEERVEFINEILDIVVVPEHSLRICFKQGLTDFMQFSLVFVALVDFGFIICFFCLIKLAFDN